MLIVEDSEDDALLVVRELKRGGYEPYWERVETPEAMKKVLAASEWDAIVSDHRMPRFGPLEPLAIYRQSGSEAPFVIVSAGLLMTPFGHPTHARSTRARCAPAAAGRGSIAT